MFKLNLKKGAVLVAILAMVGAGCGKGSNKNPVIDGVTGPTVSFVNGTFTMTMVLKTVQIDAGVRVPLKHTTNSFMEVGPDFQSSGTLISVFIDSKDLLAMTGGGFTMLDPQTLPGGRPLPGVVDGRLPAYAMQISKLKDWSFYYSSKVFGVFAPVNLNWDQVISSFRFYDSSGNAVGTLSLVGKDAQGQNSGILLLVPINARIEQMMKSRR